MASSVASDALQLDDGSVLDLLTEIAKLFCGLAENLEASQWYDTNFAIFGSFSRLAPGLNSVRDSPHLAKQIASIVGSVLNFFAAMALRCPEDVVVVIDEYWAPVLLGGFYGDILSTYECRYADFTVSSSICALMSSFLKTKYFDWLYGDNYKKNMVQLLDSFLHTALANVMTWRFNYIYKRVEHLRNIYALSALIFDVHHIAMSHTGSLDSFKNLFIADPLSGHVAHSLPSKIVDFITQMADISDNTPIAFQQKLCQPNLQSLTSALLSCMLRFYRFLGAKQSNSDEISSISVGSVDFCRNLVILSLQPEDGKDKFILNQNSKRLCFELISIILSTLGHNLSLNSLLSSEERTRFHTLIVNTISEEEKYVLVESADNERLLVIQATLGMVEVVLQYQPLFFADLAARIRPLVTSIISRFELYQTVPSLYAAALRVIAVCWRFGRHQKFANDLIEGIGAKEFWNYITCCLEGEVKKEEPYRKSEISCLLTVLDIISLEFYFFCRPGSVVNDHLCSKLRSVFENGHANARMESIFDYLLLNEENDEFFPLSKQCSHAAEVLQTFCGTISMLKLPENIISTKNKLEMMDSFVSCCNDILTDLQHVNEGPVFKRTVALGHILLPPFNRAVLTMARNWGSQIFTADDLSKSFLSKQDNLNASPISLFSNCVNLARMTLAVSVPGEQLPMRFDEPGVLSLSLLAELLNNHFNVISHCLDCGEWFIALAADLINQVLATEADDRVPSEFFSTALSVLSGLLQCCPDITTVLLRNEVFLCKLIECSATAMRENIVSPVNVDALVFLLNATHAFNDESADNRGVHELATRRIITSIANAFYNHSFFELAISFSHENTEALMKQAISLAIDIITALLLHVDSDRNSFFPIDEACAFFAVYGNRFVKVNSHQILFSISIN